jgi:hypothetical protein
MSNHQSQSAENEPLLFHPQVTRQKLSDLDMDMDMDQANDSSNSSVLQECTTIQPNSTHVSEILTGDRIVPFITITIIGSLVIGLINCLHSIHNNTIVYGTIDAYIFLVILIYYFINIIWYSIFTIIHIFILSTQLCYSVNKMEYIECIVLNYRNFYYNYLIKILFVSAMIVILFMSINNAITSIPLYYNVIIIEVVLSTLLYLCINKIINNYDFIKLINNNYTRPTIPAYTRQAYTRQAYTRPTYVDTGYNTDQIYSV